MMRVVENDMAPSKRQLILRGIKIADSAIYRQDKIWSQYSNDKVDIGEHLALILRILGKALPLNKKIRALSVGSSNEPQFRILQTGCQGGLYLLDIDKSSLEIIKERLRRQNTRNVMTILQNFNNIFNNPAKTIRFRHKFLQDKKVDLVALHHSLYYCPQESWIELFRNLYKNILAPVGVMHAVLMTNKSDNHSSTTWLYNHFAGKFCRHENNQSLEKLKRALKKERLFAGSRILFKTRSIQFFVDDFERMMAVVWMILLHPFVHEYNFGQKEEITELIYNQFYKKKKPILQIQDHLAVYRGLHFTPIVTD
ncbi:MAG: hypothetical protein A3B79_07470 [Deltaproteobacteria bacterium RIFCSPHIGHO2_02_FULL_50_15]|nr:MAG: hypothetical protein A3B79_07470 [Deltaproteobacteria bacterium RIFCSPHIGHO2_02_FULL_50_15]